MNAIISLVVFMLAIRVLITFYITPEERPPECTRHTWTKKQVDPSNPEMGSYLVCSVCKRLVGGGFEEPL